MDTIKYQIPRLGILSAQLYPNAQKTFSMLNFGTHIDRMKRNPQLGVIRNVYEGSHHTRWEYVATQLTIIHNLRQKFPGLGLSNDTPKIRGHAISGADILQCWVLLLNAGHLLGTFSTERALMSSLKSDIRLRQTFRAGLPRDREIYAFLNTILQNEEVYRVHELIAFFFLGRLRRKYRTDVDLLIDILKQFKFDPKQGIERRRMLKVLFRRIRQVAYLFLDSLYGPIPLVFELGPTLFDFERHARELFLSNNSSLLRALDEFQFLMSENFYLSQDSMYVYGLYTKHISEQISRHENLYTIKNLHNFMVNFIEPQLHLRQKDLLRLWISEQKSRIPVTPRLKPLEIEGSWNRSFPRKYCDATVERDPSNYSLGITLAFNQQIPNTRKPRIISKVMQKVISLQETYSEFKKIRPERYLSSIFETPCRELLLFMLEKVCGSNVTFIPSPHSVYQDYWAIYRGTTKAARYLNMRSERFRIRGMDRDRLREIQALVRALTDIQHRGTVLTTTSQIIVRSKDDNSDIIDLDGVAILSDASELSLLIVEAKKNRIAAAERRLRNTIQAMDLTSTTTPQIIRLRGIGAYSRISLF